MSDTLTVGRATRPPRLHGRQMRDAVQPAAADTAEVFGRGPDRVRARARPPAVARGAAQETIRHPRANVRTDRLGPEDE